MKINKQKLHTLYMEKVNEIASACEDKSIFSTEEIVELISEILENNQDLITDA